MSNTDWSPVLNASAVNDACNALYDIILNIFNDCVPQYVENKNKRHYPPWFDTTVIQYLRDKSNAHRNYKKYKSAYYQEKFKRLRSECKIRIDAAYEKYLMDIQNALTHDSKMMWSFIRRKQGRTRIPGVMKYNGDELDTPTEIMEAFCNYFSDVYTESRPTDSDQFTDQYFQTNICLPTITEENVIAALKKSKCNLLSGYDGIPSFLLHDCAISFSAPLHHIFGLIFRTSEYPEVWKTSRITPVFKAGDMSDVSNYRPISIICNFSKVLESLLSNHIYNSVTNILSSNQHGFVQKRSTTTNLTCFTQYVSEAMDEQGQVDTIYTDFQKAFDRIDHHILLAKLSNIGFSPAICSLFESYLLNRKQYVEYQGNTSRMFTPTSGIAQGSNLGPVLFLLFINDITNGLNCEHLLFADDLKIFYKIDTTADCLVLQNDLDRISSWCHRNRLHMNVNKCKILSYTRKYNTVDFDYILENGVLDRCSTVKDLGVQFDCKLNFIEHINTMIASAHRMYGFIYRNCREFTNSNCLMTLYNTFIRSKLEYGCLIWYPLYQVHNTNIETIQRKFLKFLMYILDGTYPDRGYDYEVMLDRFQVVSLLHRRNVLSVKFLYNIIHNNIDCPKILNAITFKIPRLESRYETMFYIPRSRTNIMCKSPIYVMCNNYNRICKITDINFDSITDIISRM